jgi:5-carboxymethyl-2-hydroxymuconate isomerase
VIAPGVSGREGRTAEEKKQVPESLPIVLAEHILHIQLSSLRAFQESDISARLSEVSQASTDLPNEASPSNKAAAAVV